jgi:septin family protein
MMVNTQIAAARAYKEVRETIALTEARIQVRMALLECGVAERPFCVIDHPLFGQMVVNEENWPVQ